MSVDASATVAAEPAGRAEPASLPKRAKWRPSVITALITVFGLAGLVTALYPMTSSWLSSYNQSSIIVQASENLDQIRPIPAKQLELAHQYNDALIAGVILESGGNVPVGAFPSQTGALVYEEMLRANENGLMARVRVPSIDVDLPVFHGTSHETLLRGAGHLEGSHLPVGGEGTRSVITAHRGLASSTMFTNLNQVAEGDSFSVETMGKELHYKVVTVQVIDPKDTKSLKAVPGKDLVTLITCTPLGVNSHRIVVTGERDKSVGHGDLFEGGPPTVPGFPYWALIGLAGLTLLTVFLVRGGYSDAAARSRSASVAPDVPDPSH